MQLRERADYLYESKYDLTEGQARRAISTGRKAMNFLSTLSIDQWRTMHRELIVHLRARRQ